MWEEVLLFLVPFRSQIFDAFLTSFWTFCLILMQFLYIFMRLGVESIFILCNIHVC